ncbi:MAG: hypothetical protein U9R15_08710 [Chloroflexota bacterium]|nr:hypothetical protein [Chloroflexota bacterium]
MPFGVPRTELERRERHEQLYGEEPPVKRIGRPGGLRGEPLTDEERMAIHELYYGPGSSPPVERLGLTALGSGNTVSTELIRSSDKTRIYRRVMPEDEDTLIDPFTIALAILIIKIVVAAAVVYIGLTVAHKYFEEKARKGLPLFSLSVYEPVPELIDHPDSKYFLIIDGAVSDRRVQIKFGKSKELIAVMDPVFREEYGNYTVEITGRELAEAAAKSKTLFGKIPLLRETGDVTIYMYAEEEIPWYRNLVTPIKAVRIHIPSTAEKVGELIPGWTAPIPVTPGDAAEGIIAGKRYYIKFGIPILSLLPGLPYTPGMWVPWGCIITEMR